MKLRPKAKPQAAQAWEAPRTTPKKAGKRMGNGRREGDAE